MYTNIDIFEKRIKIAFFFIYSTMITSLSPLTAASKNVVGKKPNKELSSVQTMEKELRNLQSQFKSFNHLKVKFVQNTYRSLRKRKTKSTGEALFSKPDKFRWMIQTPQESQWVFDGKSLSYFVKKTNQKSVYSANAGKGKELRQIVEMVMNVDTLLDKFKLINLQNKGQTVEVFLEPKINGEVKKAVVHLNSKSHIVEKLRLNFDHGNYSEIDFEFVHNKNITNKMYEVEK